MANRLTSIQKWQLSLSLALIYTLTVIYATTTDPLLTMDRFYHELRFALPFFTISFGLFYIWLSITDWLQLKFFNYFGENYLLEFKLQPQIISLLVSLVLAFLFNFFLHKSLRIAMEAIFHVFPPQNTPMPKRSAEMWALVVRANNGLSVMIMLTAFYLIAAVRATQRVQEIQLRSERLEKEHVQAQFAALKNQVNPHFLFNSLSILSSVVHIDANLSEKFIAQLSKSYRYILEQKDNDLVSLKTELEFIQSYAFLLEIRFREKFSVQIDVPESAQQLYKIAPLTLQLLIENAVKHTRMSSKEPLTVSIKIENQELIVENGYRPRLQPEVSTGLGLKNITARYSLLTTHAVWYGHIGDSFVVKIPLLA
ncbi:MULTISPECIES: sensor histidine kinase [unclassified Siphonobacter]|uniref:sensor histidine kinase n=1 Tax=unclassified Siphonobacter TaxID=2635712 RepID=UPI000CC1BE53|nr:MULTISPECIES: histidine kinase [unclassified Siphonobacter]MDQ1088123.1 two-component system LytT family sensor kinase [Siphonobacter sp. SORGH_AS_1065]MDR6194274.1 two-component system LytT family sensor kinase [Siphonobacter sp. SORGH_AS_0500]PKK37058.1 hypothetical protein BWI96_09285 [Siphonobacter sp. SORGH_AS_0500]